MSGSISDPFDSSPPTDKDKNVLNLIFGDRTCIDNPITKFIWYFGLAILATIVFWALTTTGINNYINGYVIPTYNLYVKIIIFFIIILLLDWFFNLWRESRPICK
jgi:hypothetical protein